MTGIITKNARDSALVLRATLMGRQRALADTNDVVEQLIQQLDAAKAEHDAKMAQLKAEWQKEIAALQAEWDVLRKELLAVREENAKLHMINDFINFVPPTDRPN